ncbi:MAG: ABC transporter ATP-binding protein [Candidatus Sedimenticola endophacoides]|uniref:ABC transporter ATP-binding protein n=1 Tax=Candidatus Sedimenticola endophacoides TaxID=2548426 RepID=A0A6N4DS95_9GAMM|nr:MAG: ABC transporter ATP-binding protein [Candidatus Sedimenticola endophacoides]PUE00853.1 MAG: ABC transporter ATP-binding protein [Candidatus Sedimenticola endophacoides]PUE02432.1 MAG: ABC transporter ATP-binding protein [Candidatus Sedimenticola endophacoides]
MDNNKSDSGGQRTSPRFQVPGSWSRPDVLIASLGINILALMLPMVVLQVYDRIIPNQALDTFTVLMFGMLAVALLEAFLRILRSVMLAWGGARFEHRESLKALRHILHADTLAFNRDPSGNYLNRMQAVEEVHQFYSGQSMLLMMDFPFILLFLALIWIISGTLILVPLTLLGVFAVASYVMGQQLHRALKARHQTDTNRQNFLTEVLSGIHTVKSMAMEALMQRRYERLQAQSAARVEELAHINSVVQGFGTTFSQLAMVSFVGFGAGLVVDGTLTVGALAAGTMLSGRVLQPGLKAMSLWTQFQGVRLALERCNEIYEMPRELTGQLSGQKPVEGRIELRNVRFKYPEQERMLLDGISLEIRPGEAIGITGNNGVGKSTLIAILTGFIPPSEGQVLLDDHELGEYDQEYLRRQIGFMPQHGILYEGTILENMTLFREGAVVEHAIELSRELGLDKIIATMPEGLDTLIGGSAVDTLSEGVRQKIVIVRSLVGHPKVVLFDDANASFDIRNDSNLLRMMQKLRGDRSMVIVSHRPSFLRLCDRQFELRHGVLRQTRSHKLQMVFNR